MTSSEAPVHGDRLLGSLSQEQAEAVVSKRDRTVVIAGPGTGKTRVLAARVVWLMRLRGVKPEEIVAFTFTREAATELRRRVAASVGDELAERLWCGTFHGFAAGVLARVLDDASRVADDDEEEAVLRGLVGGEERRPEFAKLGITALRDVCERWGAGVLEADKHIPFVLARFDRLRLRARFALVRNAAMLLANGNGLHAPAARDAELDRVRHVDHVLVDEAQDVTASEASLLAAFRPESSLFAVLDEDQSIFGWRHASATNLWPLLATGEDPATRLHLSRSYRFGPKLAAAATAWIRRAPALLGVGIEETNVPWANPDHTKRLVEQVVLISAVRHPSQIAVLARTNARCADIAVDLNAAGVPARHITRDGDSSMSGRKLRAAVAVARLILNPKDDAALHALAKAFWIPSQRVLDWKAAAGILPLAAAAAADGFAPAQFALSVADDPAVTWESIAEAVQTGQGRLDEFEHIGKQHGIVADDSPASALEKFAGRSEQSAFDVAAKAGLVAVATLHAAKGREWEAVVLADFPADAVSLSLEERRCWYVGMTRAKRHLVTAGPYEEGR